MFVFLFLVFYKGIERLYAPDKHKRKINTREAEEEGYIVVIVK